MHGVCSVVFLLYVTYRVIGILHYIIYSVSVKISKTGMPNETDSKHPVFVKSRNPEAQLQLGGSDRKGRDTVLLSRIGIGTVFSACRRK